MANINTLFAMLLGCAKGFEAYRSQFFADFDRFVVLTSLSDAYISRSGDFCGDDRQTKPIALPLAHARGVKRTIVQKPWCVAIEQSWWLPKYIRACHRMIYSMQS